MIIHIGDQSDEGGEFWQTLPSSELNETFGSCILLFRSVRNSLGKFFFRGRFLRRGRVTDFEENNFHVAMGWSR